MKSVEGISGQGYVCVPLNRVNHCRCLQQCMLDGLADVQVVSMCACNIYTVLTTLQLCCIGKLYLREKLCKMICEATVLHP